MIGVFVGAGVLVLAGAVVLVGAGVLLGAGIFVAGGAVRVGAAPGVGLVGPGCALAAGAPVGLNVVPGFMVGVRGPLVAAGRGVSDAGLALPGVSTAVGRLK